MKCMFCGSEESKVIESRETNDNSIRRRRECLKCGKRFTTYESVNVLPLMVVKRDGKKEIYSREKIKNSILIAFAKEYIMEDVLNDTLDQIDNRIFSTFTDEVSSVQIGTIVLSYLKKLNTGAYIRYATVFNGVTSSDEVKFLLH